MKNDSKTKKKAIELFKPEIILILSDLSNYIKADKYYKTKIYKCAYCKKNIKRSGIHNHIFLWSKSENYFICFHIKCAFKVDIVEPLDEILSDFDYIYDIDDNRNKMKLINKGE